MSNIASHSTYHVHSGSESNTISRPRCVRLRSVTAVGTVTIHGHLSDDLDLTVGRKRSRRISVNSFNTIRSRKSEEGTTNEDAQGHFIGSPEPRGRLWRGSRVSYSRGGSLGPSVSAGSSSRTLPLTGATPTIRQNRLRTNSTASSINSHFHVQAPSVAVPFSSTGSMSFSAMLPDNSQRG